MKIAVCDDEEKFRASIKDAVYEYSNKHRYEFAIDEFVSGEELLNSKKKYDLILLDYQMSGINGLETARKLREKNIDCTIIFMTSHPHFVYEAFEVSTYRFFAKPLDITKLYKAFDDYFKAYGNDYPIILKIDRETVCVQTKDIVYLEADNKKCFIHLAKKKYHCAKTMAAIALLLPKQAFFRVHRSYIVNFRHIDNYDNGNIYLKNKAVAHMSRNHLKAFRSAYLAYTKSYNIMPLKG